MIRRAPRPDGGFLMLRNDVARDARLSYRASGILADLLSRPDNWQTSAERLAGARPGQEGVKAVRSALNELERAGYLVRRRLKGEKGRFTWEQVVYDTPQSVFPGHAMRPKPSDGNGRMASPAQTGVSAGHAISPSPSDGQGTSKEDLEEDLEDREEDELDRSAARSARAGATEEDQLTVVTGINDWRAEDRSLFLAIIGSEKLRSYGHEPWNEGVFETRLFYDAFRKALKPPAKPMKWPGRFFESLDDVNPATGVDDWLLSQGLERVA